MGNNTVQQKDISCSKRILGNEARDHINIKISITVFNAKVRGYNLVSFEVSINHSGKSRMLNSCTLKLKNPINLINSNIKGNQDK